MLCLHQCLPACILLWDFCLSALSLHAHLECLFLSQIYIYVLCATSLLCALATMHIMLLPARITIKISNNIFFVLHIFIMPTPLPNHTPNSLFSLTIMLSLFFISCFYPEILWLLWQLQSSTLFHLSIVSMMSIHSTGSYLETLHLLWWSPWSSSNSLVDTISPFWKL